MELVYCYIVEMSLALLLRKNSNLAEYIMSEEKVVAVSGYFDPIHVGHIEYFKLAKEFGTKLVVIVNNDHQCYIKKGKPFMKQEDRLKIVESIKGVDEAFLSIDEDKTVCKSLSEVNPDIFANGGDRHNKEIPEAKVCRKYDIELVDGLGNKIRSSSDLTGLKEK